jgi:urease accessory protein
VKEILNMAGIGVLAPPQRTRGSAIIAVAGRHGAMHLERLRQDGSLKVLWPTSDHDSTREAVLLNTAGGLTGGDRLSVSVSVGSGARLIVSTQAAERVYRSADGTADVRAELKVGPGGRLDWLPQETILYDNASLDRRLSLDLAPGGRALLVEPVILGRRAMGERVRQASVHDRWEVRQDGRLLFADRLRVEGKAWGSLMTAGMLGGAGAWANFVLLCPDAAARLGSLRRLLPPNAGASLVREGVLFGRILAVDGFELRQGLIPALELLGGRPLPKVWRL